MGPSDVTRTNVNLCVPREVAIIALGISLPGLIQIPLAGFFYERLRGISPWGARLGFYGFRAGSHDPDRDYP